MHQNAPLPDKKLKIKHFLGGAHNWLIGTQNAFRLNFHTPYINIKTRAQNASMQHCKKKNEKNSGEGPQPLHSPLSHWGGDKTQVTQTS